MSILGCVLWLSTVTAIAGEDGAPPVGSSDAPATGHGERSGATLEAYAWTPPAARDRAHREVRRVRPGVFAFRGQLLDYHLIREDLRTTPHTAAARLDGKARSLEVATWSLLGLSAAGFVVSGAMYPSTEGATLVLGFPVAAVPTVAALVTGLEALRMRRLAVDALVRDDLKLTEREPVLLVPTFGVRSEGFHIGLAGSF